MKFVPMSRIYLDQPIYGAAKGAFMFIITEDGAAHRSFSEAQKACQTFYRNRNA